MTLTKVETQQLVDEFIQFQINEMSKDELESYAANHLRNGIKQSKETLEMQINKYDDFNYLYEILVDYIQDKPNSYQAYNDYINERQEQWCYE